MGISIIHHIQDKEIIYISRIQDFQDKEIIAGGISQANMSEGMKWYIGDDFPTVT